jgi:hypothetical protein
MMVGIVSGTADGGETTRVVTMRSTGTRQPASGSRSLIQAPQ